MLYGVILGIHVLVCLVLCLIVLLQSSKGSGLAGGAAFGGGADSTVFGGRGAATFLSKATTIFGVAFMVTSLTLTLLGKASAGRAKSAIAEEARQSGLGIPTETAPPTSAPGEAPPLGGLPVGPTTPAPIDPAAPGSPAPADPSTTPPGGGTTTPDGG